MPKETPPGPGQWGPRTTSRTDTHPPVEAPPGSLTAESELQPGAS